MDIADFIKPLKEEEPYLRPFVGDGINKKFDVFLVGINPATPIRGTDIPSDKDFAEIIQNKEKFYQFYEEFRMKNGKTPRSKTRKNIEKFVKELEIITGREILETNVIPYPTANLKELKGVDKDSIDYAISKFSQLLLNHQPTVIVLHGKRAFKEFYKLLEQQQITFSEEVKTTMSKSELENQVYLSSFQYGKDGPTAQVFYSRHLCYFGMKSSYFAHFYKTLKAEVI